jgi:hypothetical protein
MRGPEIIAWLFLAGGAVFALHAISLLIAEVNAARSWPRVTSRVISRDPETIGQTEYGEPLWVPTVRFGDTAVRLADSMNEVETRVGATIELTHPPGRPLEARIRKSRFGAAILQLVIALACATIGYVLRGGVLASFPR